jgi:hypothetical protein
VTLLEKAPASFQYHCRLALLASVTIPSWLQQVHLAHNPESSSNVSICCEALATISYWLQSLASKGRVPEELLILHYHHKKRLAGSAGTKSIDLSRSYNISRLPVLITRHYIYILQNTQQSFQPSIIFVVRSNQVACLTPCILRIRLQPGMRTLIQLWPFRPPSIRVRHAVPHIAIDFEGVRNCVLQPQSALVQGCNYFVHLSPAKRKLVYGGTVYIVSPCQRE